MSVSDRSGVQTAELPGTGRAAVRTIARPAAPPVRALTRDFLAWLADGPRTYAEVMEAWRTSCPRLSIWEDALDEGLVRSERGDESMGGQVIVMLTPRGRAVLDGQA